MSNLVFNLIQRGFAMNIVRTIFVALDLVAFTAFKWSTQAVFDIASVSLISEDQFVAFAKRIYVILGLFMLFKVVITMLGYLIDPDKINDKTEGLSKIIGRVLVSICMLVGFPFVFNFIGSKDTTETLLKAVPRLLIGKNSQISSNREEMGDFADTIVWKTYSIAFNVKNGEDNYLEITEFNTLDAALERVNDDTGDKSVYKYHYIPVIGMIIGIVMSFIMLGIAIDVAIRAFKLIILRMLAPIPIISYILPKSSKDGGIFNNWVKTLVSTWADLFIKIGVVYFVLYMIDLLILGNNFDFGVTGIRKLAVIIFVVIGLLLFAKQAPKFITDLLGIKSPKGSLGLSGMAAAGAGLLTGAGIGGALAAGANQLMTGANNQAEGKAAGSGWSKGREIATQLKAGNKDAKPLSMMDRMNNAAMRRSLAKKGITKNSIADAETNIQQLKDNLSASQTRLSDMQSLNSAYSTRKSLDTQIANLSSSRDAIVGDGAEQQQQRALINTQIAQLEAQKASNDAQISRLESNPSYAGVSEGNIESRINNLQTEIGNRQEVIADAQEKYSDSKSKYKAATGKYNGKPTSEFKVGIHDGVSTGKINQTDKTKN